MSKLRKMNSSEEFVKETIKDSNIPTKVKRVSPSSERIIKQTSVKRKALMMALADR